MTILESLPLARLHFDLQALENADVPPYKGDLLRMALLWWLSEFWCPQSSRCRDGCRRPDVCMFGRLCEPLINPAWPPTMQRLMGDTPPPAYAVWDLHDRRTRLREGDAWSFEIVLMGALAVSQIPAIGAAVQRGAEQGMGRIHLRSRVLKVRALAHQASELCLAAEKPQNGGLALTWQSYRTEDVTTSYRQAVDWSQQFTTPLRALSLRYLSPVKIKERGQWVESPQFAAVMKAVVRRLRILSLVHGAGEWPQSEYGPLLDIAESVRLEHQETLWARYSRESKRSGEYDVEGFVGQAWYAGDDLRPLLPALWLGQWLHIGKGYVLGNGRYEIATLPQ